MCVVLPAQTHPEVQKCILNYLFSYTMEDKSMHYGQNSSIIHVFRKKYIANKCAEELVLKVLSSSRFCFTEVFEDRINHHQMLLSKK